MGKRTLLILFLTVLTYGMNASQTGAQHSPQALFDRGNTELQEGNIEEALSYYQQLSRQEAISGGLYLNMGISYVRLDSLGKAKYYFLKASRFDETEEKAVKALNYVEERFSRQSAVLPKLPWEKAVDWLKNNIGASVMLGTGIIFVNFGVFCIVAGWFYRRWGKELKIAGISMSLLALLIVLSSFYVQYVAKRYQQAVMVQQQVNVLEKPADESSIVSQAYEGYTFTVDTYRSDEYPGWKYVRMSNGLYGWIPMDKIMIL